jgi:RNA recognition motif-containing protein
MAGIPDATVYIGNLDERVDERILYEIMVQAGPLVNVNIPRDNDSKKHKGYGFAEYTTESNAQYAVRLFSGLVCLHNRPLRFQISGQGAALQQPSPKPMQSTQIRPSPQIANPHRAFCKSPSVSPAGSGKACNSPAERKKTATYKKSPLSNNPTVADTQRCRAQFTAIDHMGFGSPLPGTRYSCASPSY